MSVGESVKKRVLLALFYLRISKKIMFMFSITVGMSEIRVTPRNFSKVTLYNFCKITIDHRNSVMSTRIPNIHFVHLDPPPNKCKSE